MCVFNYTVNIGSVVVIKKLKGKKITGRVTGYLSVKTTGSIPLFWYLKYKTYYCNKKIILNNILLIGCKEIRCPFCS